MPKDAGGHGSNPKGSIMGSGGPHGFKGHTARNDRNFNETAYKTPYAKRTSEQKKVTGTVGAYGGAENFNWKTWRESREK